MLDYTGSTVLLMYGAITSHTSPSLCVQATTLLSSVAVTQKEVRGASLLEYLSTGLYTMLSARQHTGQLVERKRNEAIYVLVYVQYLCLLSSSRHVGILFLCSYVKCVYIFTVEPFSSGHLGTREHCPD